MPRIPNPRRLVRRVAGISEDILGGAADLAGSLTGGTLDTFGGIGDIAQRAADYVSSAPAAASGLSDRIGALSSALASVPGAATDETGDILGGARSLLGWGTDAGGTVTADLGDVFSRARAYTGDVAGGLPGAAQRVLRYEPQEDLGSTLERAGVTGLGHRLTEGLRLDQLVDQSPALEQAGNLLFTRQGGAGIDTSNPADLLKLQGRFAQVGHAVAEEPIAYGLNALTGGAAPSGPFSGTQAQTLHERAGELPGPLRYAGAAGTTALDWATDPTTWALGAGNIGREIAARGLAGGLGAEAANLGKFAALAGMGGEAAADLADRLGLATTPAERERARMVGNLAAPVAGGVAERLLHRPTVLGAAPEEAAAPRAPWQMPRDEFIANRRQPTRGTPEPTVDALRATVAPSGPPGISVEPGMLNGVPMPQLEHNVVYRDDQGTVRGVLVVNHSVPGEPPLLEVAVEPAYRGRGIAQALYQAGTDAGLPIDEATGVGGYTEAGAGLAHRRAVTTALQQGKPVPSDVLADYPDLAAAPPATDAAVTDLHAGFNPLTGARVVLEHPRVFGPAIGAAVGYSQGDTPEERAKNAAIGAVAGFGGGFALSEVPAAIKVARAVFLPSSLRGQDINDAVQTYNKATRGAARLEARNARVDATLPFKQFQRAVAEGGVQETPAQAARTDQYIAQARATAAAATDPTVRAWYEEQARMIDATRLADPIIRDNGVQNYVLTPAAQRAKDALDVLYLRQTNADLKAGVLDAAAMRTEYQNRVWGERPPPDTAAAPGAPVARGPGQQQGFQKGRTLDNFQEGMALGYRPATLDTPSLLEARVEAGYTAAAQQALRQRIVQDPEMLRETPAPGYVKPGETLLRRLFGPDAPAERPVFLRADVADALDAYFAPGPRGAAVRGVQSVTGAMRELRLGMDVAQIGRLVPQAFMQTVAGSLTNLREAGPVGGVLRAGGAVAAAFRDSLTPGTREAMLRSDRYQAWSRHMEGLGPGDLGDVLARPEGGTALSRIPGVNLAYRAVGEPLEKWQFGAFVPALKFHVAEALRASLGKSRAFRGMSDEALMDSIGRRVDTGLSGFSATRAGVSRAHETVNQMAMLSPTWARGAVANLTDVTKGGPEGYLARRFWATMATGAVGATVGLSMALTGDTSLEHLEHLLDPRNPDSVTNPNGRHFLRVQLPGGGQLDPWGPVRPIAQALLKPVGTTAGTVAASRDQGKPLKAALLDGISTLANPDTTEAVRDWIEGRRAIPLGLAVDITRNKNFIDQPIATADTGAGRMRQRLVYAGTQLAPGVGNVGLDTTKGTAPDWNVSFGNVQRGVGQALGVTVTPGPHDPAAITDTIRAFAAAQGQHPGADPVGWIRKGQGVPFDALQQFRAEHPEVQAHIDQTREQQRQMRARPVGQDAARTFTSERQSLQRIRDAALTQAAAAYQQSGDGPAYRRATSRAWDTYNGAVSGVSNYVYGTPDIAEAQKRLIQAFGASDPTVEPVSAAYDEYEAIQPIDESRSALDAAMTAKRSYLAPGGGADQRYGTGTGARLTAGLRDIARQRGGETYARLQDAQRVWGDYAQISPYAGMDAAQARQVNVLISRAQDRAKYVYGGVLPVKTAILLDTSADKRTRVLAMLAEGNKLTNPARKVFVRQHARDMAEFFSDVTADDLTNIRGAA
jgi:GNAT superfamily N-acetyltransferase